MDEATGLYDYGARYYDPAVARWGQVDLLAEKFTADSPYSYVFNNPLLYIDPDGMVPTTVNPMDDKALQVIKNTLPADARSYVQVNQSTGNIDTELLSQYSNSSRSENFSTLLNLSKSSTVYEVGVVSGDHATAPFVIDGNEYPADPEYFGPAREMTVEEKANGYNGEPAYNLSTGEAAESNIGMNMPPGISASGNLQVLVNGNLSVQGQVETMAHELYGHAGAPSGVNPNHNIGASGEQNTGLKNWIISRVNEAISNFKQ